MNHNLIENSPSCINTAWLRRALPLGHRELSSSPARVHRCLDFKDLLVWPIWVFWVTSDNKVSNWRLGKGSGSISSSELKQRNTVSSLLRFGSQRWTAPTGHAKTTLTPTTVSLQVNLLFEARSHSLENCRILHDCSCSFSLISMFVFSEVVVNT
ncbi:uncharacterized protein LOC126785415 isoform X1 [Argentina anserina]|uniref:uncharacterized protein LOC126785415 isoform X1 n=1 Tax=Argentina anserina TaxID=57926 RepID=UPI0021769479|nr:uncharacterized protein LOC126785415 isoform X1 [Potentilla anserina]